MRAIHVKYTPSSVSNWQLHGDGQPSRLPTSGPTAHWVVFPVGEYIGSLFHPFPSC